MTTKTVHKLEQLQAQVVLPASKSISNRALIINALSGAAITPLNVSDCDDTRVMVKALSQTDEVVDIMAAGTAMRFLTAYFSVTPGEHVLTGTERMKHRPIAILVDALRQLGADIQYEGEEGFPPLRIKGKRLQGGHIELAGHVSSQYISAMLMIGPVLEEGLCLHLTGGIVSRPYIDMTLGIMQTFGAVATFEGDTIKVEPTGYKAVPYCIENDWSAASYWYELVALTPGAVVTLPGLFRKSGQGDQAVQEVFRSLGVESLPVTTAVQQGGEEPDSPCAQEAWQLRHTGQCVPRLDIDMLRIPDLAQTVVVTCALLGIPFRITGLQSLKIKETDRITALCTELRKVGYLIRDAEDSILYWEGERIATNLPTPAIDTYEDHRMAMAFAPACQVLGEIRIHHPEVVSKSYPRYWEDLRKVGFAQEDVE